MIYSPESNIFIFIYSTKVAKQLNNKSAKKEKQPNLTKIQNTLQQFNIKRTLKTVKSVVQSQLL